MNIDIASDTTVAINSIAELIAAHFELEYIALSVNSDWECAQIFADCELRLRTCLKDIQELYLSAADCAKQIQASLNTAESSM